jgi:hypothetical protein
MSKRRVTKEQLTDPGKSQQVSVVKPVLQSEPVHMKSKKKRGIGADMQIQYK